MNCLGRPTLEVHVLAAPSGDFTTLGEAAAGRNSHEKMTPGNFPASPAVLRVKPQATTLKEPFEVAPAEV
jgi:hypothetical protein